MTDSAFASDERADDRLVDERAIRQQTLLGRTILLLGIVASVAVCFGVGKLFAISDDSEMATSLLQQPHWFISLVVVFVSSLIAVFVSGTITRAIRPEAALACAGFGLGSFSLRGGTMQTLLFAASGAGVFVQLAIQVVALFAVLAVAWRIYQRSRFEEKLPTVKPDEMALAIFAHAAVMTALMLLICRSDAKMQCIVGVGICAAAASIVARQIVTIDSLGWLWISPLIVAVLGYLISWTHPASMQIGVLYGAFAPLARPLPLEYAGMGTAGTIIGYWMGGGDGTSEEVDDDSV